MYIYSIFLLFFFFFDQQLAQLSAVTLGERDNHRPNFVHNINIDLEIPF